MNPPPLPAPLPASRPFRLGLAVLAALAAAFLFAVIGLVGMFYLSSETGALRRSVVRSVPGAWDTRVAVRLGGITTGLVRLGSRFLPLDPEPRAAIDALHGIEVGVYHLPCPPESANLARALADADKAMSRRGWDRVVGVISDGTLVAAYLPHRRLSPRNLRCCVAVFSGQELVVGSARGNLEPLLAIAAERPEFHHAFDNLARLR